MGRALAVILCCLRHVDIAILAEHDREPVEVFGDVKVMRLFLWDMSHEVGVAGGGFCTGQLRAIREI